MAVGKNFLENLTVAMYENSFTVYREYIQNSADSIDKAIREGLLSQDKAFIDISIEYSKRKISVYDNACGIPVKEFKKKMTDVADSDKDRDTEKGFRGIGRLAGLGYCEKLIFSTSCSGENKKSVITWDGTLLRKIVDDPHLHPTSEELITQITNIEYFPAPIEDHYFEVVMEDVTFESDDLLDESLVAKYLRSVAPIPYENYFIFSSKVHEFAQINGFRIDEYKVTVNGQQIFKPYRTILYEGSLDAKKRYDEIVDVQFKIFEAKDGTPIAWMWYGIAKFEKNIPVVNEMRCIRLRKENIQIGDEDTIGYPKFFKESRGNGYYIGEVFAVDVNLIPNARRDYFNQNQACRNFEESLYYFFHNELYDLYHYASKVRSAEKQVAAFQRKEAEYKEKVDNAGFIDPDEKEAAEKELEEEKTKCDKAERELANRKKDAEANEVFNRVFNEIEKTYKCSEQPEEKELPAGKKKKEKKQKYMTQNLSQLTTDQRKLISKVYNIIKMILPKDMAELVITKIQEELSK